MGVIVIVIVIVVIPQENKVQTQLVAHMGFDNKKCPYWQMRARLMYPFKTMVTTESCRLGQF